MQILEGGADGIRGCFLAVAAMPPNSFYLTIFLQSLSATLTRHCNLLLKPGSLCSSLTSCFKTCSAVGCNFVWQSGLTIMSEGCLINSNDVFKRVDTVFCIEIIIKSLSRQAALQWKCSRGSSGSISMHKKKTVQ